MSAEPMSETPKGLRLHMALLGRRNVGKSSLLNALSGQDVAIVSDTPGTTTDPVEKTLEMAPLGPVVFLDTAGLDDVGELGHLRAERSLRALERTDMALLVSDGPWGETENTIAEALRARKIPFVIVFNKSDLRPDETPLPTSETAPRVRVSTVSGEGLAELRHLLAEIAPDSSLLDPPLVSDLVPDQGVILFVTPIDSGAPKGRLILPQVQSLRDSLDGGKICVVVRESEVSAALSSLRTPPALTVCDSQVVHTVNSLLPQELPLTTFSVLMARFKGDLPSLARGAALLRRLRPGDAVAIQEACSHHAQKDDIGRVKLPRLLRQMAGGDLRIRMDAGKEFPDYDPDCKLVIHCGACVITRGQMLARLRTALAHGCPMTNYGLAISEARGVLRRVLSPFPEALQAYEEAAR